MEAFAVLAFDATGWGDELLRGFAVTVSLAFATLPLGLALGLAVASLSLSRHAVARLVGRGYVVVFRGIPELLTLFLVYNGAALLLNALAKRLDPDAGFVELSPFVAGMVALGLVFGAYAGEVLRGAFLALDRGQVEAAEAFGMRRAQILRRITLPQVWRHALPGLGNLWLNLIKDTALVSIIALADVMRAANVAVGVTKQPFTLYLAVCVLYWLFCVTSEVVVGRLERRVNRGVARA